MSLSLEAQAPAPPAAPDAPPAPFAPVPPPPQRSVFENPVNPVIAADFQVANSCNCPVYVYLSPSADATWPPPITVQTDTIFHAPMIGDLPFDVAIQQCSADGTLNEFKLKGINYPKLAQADEPQLYNLTFILTGRFRKVGDTWQPLAIPAGSIAKIQMLIGDRRAMLIIPMTVRYDAPGAIPKR
jgi:hypothetical protein